MAAGLQLFRRNYPSRLGERVGVFGLVNVLGRHGMLSPVEERFRRENNDWYNAAYPDPTRVGDSAYDQQANPHAAAWFKPAASELISRIHGYLAILDAHQIAWERAQTTDPGRIVYGDAYQVVAVPHHGPVTLT